MFAQPARFLTPILLSISLAGFSATATAALYLPAPAKETVAAIVDGLPSTPVLRVGQPVIRSLQQDMGEWHFSEDGRAQWQLAIGTQDARFIGMKLHAPQLPDGARMWLSSASGPHATQAVGRDDQLANGALWLPVVPGSQALLHADMPASQISTFAPGTATIHYGTFPLFDRDSPQAKAVGDAGGCHNDVVCSEGDDWPEAIRATVRVIIGNQLLCTGVLLNNTRNDGDPLLVTADHCGIRSDDSSEGFPASSVTAQFNFQTNACGTNTGVRNDDTLQGNSLLYRDTFSDTTLIRLRNAPPERFGAVYAGWDASGAGAASGSGVHHPSGDAKKISLFDTPTQQQTVTITDGALLGPRNQEVDAWRVTWSNGVTEPGSSGSGLWNPQQRMIGVLSGGTSECADGGALGGLIGGGGEDNQGPDFYGRLTVAFDREGELGTPLRAFLAPGSGANTVGPRGSGSGSTRVPTTTTTDSGSDSGGGGGAFGWSLLLLAGAFGVRARRRQRALR